MDTSRSLQAGDDLPLNPVNLLLYAETVWLRLGGKVRHHGLSFDFKDNQRRIRLTARLDLPMAARAFTNWYQEGLHSFLHADVRTIDEWFRRYGRTSFQPFETRDGIAAQIVPSTAWQAEVGTYLAIALGQPGRR